MATGLRSQAPSYLRMLLLCGAACPLWLASMSAHAEVTERPQPGKAAALAEALKAQQQTQQQTNNDLLKILDPHAAVQNELPLKPLKVTIPHLKTVKQTNTPRTKLQLPKANPASAAKAETPPPALPELPKLHVTLPWLQEKQPETPPSPAPAQPEQRADAASASAAPKWMEWLLDNLEPPSKAHKASDPHRARPQQTAAQEEPAPAREVAASEPPSAPETPAQQTIADIPVFTYRASAEPSPVTSDAYLEHAVTINTATIAHPVSTPAAPAASANATDTVTIAPPKDAWFEQLFANAAAATPASSVAKANTSTPASAASVDKTADATASPTSKAARTETAQPTWFERLFTSANAATPDTGDQTVAATAMAQAAEPLPEQQAADTTWQAVPAIPVAQAGDDAPASPVSEQADAPLYHSPGIVLKKETLHQAILQPGVDARQFAQLAPAAGDSGTMANTPLIALPENVPPASAMTAPTAPSPSTEAEAEANRIRQEAEGMIEQTAGQMETKKREATAATLPVTPAQQPNDPLQTLLNPSQQTALPSLDLPPEEQAARPTPPAATAAQPIAPKPVAAKPERPAPEATPLVLKDENGEPVSELSHESLNILKRIPSGIESQAAKPAQRLDITRSKATDDLFKAVPGTPDTAKHEALGIKIEVKKPSLDLNYELEKAYEAMIGGHSPTAINIYKNVLENDPTNKDALFGLATLYHRAGQTDQARHYYGQLLSLHPNHRDGLNNFLVLMADESPEEALAQLGRLEARNPGFSPIPAQMAVIYHKLGQEDQATERMFRAVQLAPENLTYRYNLAIMLDRQKKYDEAARLYRQLVEAYHRGETMPGNIQNIQQRLTFISSNKP